MTQEQLAAIERLEEMFQKAEASKGRGTQHLSAYRAAAESLYEACDWLLPLAKRGLEADGYRRLLSEIVKRFPQREQMQPLVRRAVELLKSECSNCGEVTLPWEGHGPCNPVLPELRSQLAAVTAERDSLRERLICEYCDADVNVPEAEPVQFGCCRRCLERLQGERERLQFALEYLSQCGMQASDMNQYASDALAAARQSQEKTP